MSRHLWVVEIYEEEFGGTWSPTVGVRLTRDECRDERRLWEMRNPDDRFCVVKYVPEERER